MILEKTKHEKMECRGKQTHRSGARPPSVPEKQCNTLQAIFRSSGNSDPTADVKNRIKAADTNLLDSTANGSLRHAVWSDGPAFHEFDRVAQQYFKSHTIKLIEGKSTAPDRMAKGSVHNKIKQTDIRNPNSTPNTSGQDTTTRRVAIHLNHIAMAPQHRRQARPASVHRSTAALHSLVLHFFRNHLFPQPTTNSKPNNSLSAPPMKSYSQ